MEAEYDEADPEVEEAPTSSGKKPKATVKDGGGGGNDPPTPPKNPASMPVRG